MRTTLASLAAISLFFTVPASAAVHPLDALDAGEIASAVNLLEVAGRADDETLFVAVSLEEPPKQAVLAWQTGDPIGRRARVVMRHGGVTVRAIVDLDERRVASIDEIPGAQPNIATPEIFSGMLAAIGDPRMQEGLAKRGITDLEQLFCVPRTVGNFGSEEEMTRRLAKVDCFDTRGIQTDVFARPIEGLFATVDLDTGEVLEVTDLGVVPIPGGESELDPASVGPQREVKPVVVTHPAGSNIVVDGSWIEWQKWSFHVRWDVRAGVVLSLVGYDGAEGPRSILYQGSLAEIFVPYQDPTEGWYFRNYMDQGDYGLGTMGSELMAGSDCPGTSVFISPLMANAKGGSDRLANRICIFERSLGDPVWRHYDLVSEVTSARPGLELVVRYIAAVGNYDYVFDWLLDQGGNISFRGGATGIDSVKGVRSQSLADATADDDTTWGPLIAPGRAGINHDHFFSVRLDLDVDGTVNSFVRDRLVPERLPTHSLRRSVW